MPARSISAASRARAVLLALGWALGPGTASVVTAALPSAAFAQKPKGKPKPEKPPEPEAPKDVVGRGLEAAKKGDCVRAVLLLEEPSRSAASPRVPFALAGCYVAVGDLLKASELYRKVAAATPEPDWSLADRAAAEQAKKRREEVDARIPELRLKPAAAYDQLVVQVNGETVADLREPIRLDPDKAAVVVARARGYDEISERVTLPERARKELVLELVASEKRVTAPAGPPPRLGARGRALVVPQFVMNWFGDGGATVVAPGGALVFTTSAGDADVLLGLGYASYRLGDTTYKPRGTPDTEWELLSSDLQSLYFTVGIGKTFALDSSGSLRLTVAGSIGVGWTFLGALRRNQLFPRDGEPGDPSTYERCAGPNDPAGTFRYCNALDKDADHYGDFEEPSWFSGGWEPTVYPWLALPELVLAYDLTPRVSLDLELGLTLGGALAGLGFRVAL